MKLTSTIWAPPGFFDPEPPAKCATCHEHINPHRVEHCVAPECRFWEYHTECSFLCETGQHRFCAKHRHDGCDCAAVLENERAQREVMERKVA